MNTSTGSPLQHSLPSSNARQARLDELTSRLEANARSQRALDAERLRLLAEVIAVTQSRHEQSLREIEYRAVRAEVAVLLGISEYRVEREMSLAFTVRTNFPQVAHALESGSVDLQHVRVIVDAGQVLGVGSDADSVSRRSSYAAAVLETALRETPGRLQPVARRLAEQWAESPIEERHREARSARCVYVVDRDNGMADLIAHLSAVDAYSAKDYLTSLARATERAERKERAAQANSGRTAATGSASISASASASASASTSDLATRSTARTLNEIRADALRDLLLEAPQPEAAEPQERSRRLTTGVHSSRVVARVQIVIPVSILDSATGGDRGTSELVGYGPISAESAREVASRETSWEQIRVDATNGNVLSVARYRPSNEIRRRLSLRDAHCRFPGCRIPTSRCDLDHTIDAAKGGRTSTDNLAHLCRGHHTLKHHGGWQVSQGRGGLMNWTSPAGRKYVDRARSYAPEPSQPVRFTATEIASESRSSSSPGGSRAREAPHEPEPPF